MRTLGLLVCAVVLLAVVVGVFQSYGTAEEPSHCTGVRGFHPKQCPFTVRRMQAVLASKCQGDMAPVSAESWSSHAAALATPAVCAGLRAPQLPRLIVIVGAGPVGLMNALAMVEAGVPPLSLVVVEERTDYNRDTWFDLDSATQAVLLRWGSQAIDDLGVINHSGTATISIRCQVLERFLARAAAAVGVQLRYGTRFMGMCETTAVLATTPTVQHPWNCEALPEWASLVAGVRLLVAADGSRSVARQSLGLSYPPVDKVFPIPSFPDDFDALWLAENEEEEASYATNVPGLHQVSVILRLRPQRDGKCAKTRDMLPWEPSFVETLSGKVTHVFKRHFENYCEIQILLSRGCGLEVLQQYSTSAGTERLPLELVLDVLDVVLETSLQDRAMLLSALEDRGGNPFVLVFPIAIHRVTPAPLVENGGLMGYVVGDAKMTAYYRLGIGINAAAEDLRFSRELAALLLEPSVDPFRWKRLVHHINDQTDRNARYQSASVFFEAYCDLLVLQDPDDSLGDFLSRMLVFRKTKDSYDDFPLESFTEALRHCTT